MTEQMTPQCENRFDRIAERQDAIVDTLTAMNITLGEQHLSLKEHMARTEMLETRMDSAEKVIIPIKSHILVFNTGVKLLGVTATILAVLHYLKVFNVI